MERRIYRFLSLVFIAFLCGGCEDLYGEFGDFTPSAFMRYLRLSETSFEYESSRAHKVQFIVESMDTEWEFSNSNNWFTLSPNKGNTTTEISMSIQENPSGESSRIGLFELNSLESDWTYSKTLSVSQFAATPYLKIKNNYFTFSGGSDQEEIAISSNCTWTAYSSDSWIQLEKGNEGNSLIVKVVPNPGKSSREGTISISCKSNYTTVYIYQYPSQITSSDASLSFDNTASTLSVSIISAADWNVSTNRSWIFVSPSSGTSGKHEINISVAPNYSISNRKGVISFYTGDAVKAQIEVEQKGLYIETKKESLQFTSKENKQSLEILSNTDWQITSYPEWLEFSALSGNGTKTVEVTSIDNPSLNSRNGKVIITLEGLDISHEIEVIQLGKNFDIPNSYMEFPHYACSQTFNLYSELPWTSYILSPDWISTNQQSGNTDAEIIVSVIENNSYDERTGSIKYMVEGMSKKIIVNQQAKYFTINDKVFNFTSKGGEVDISFGTNEKWTATIEDNLDWLSLSATSGEGDGNITLSVGDNPAVNSRSAVVVIDTGIGHTYRIPVSQAARYLKVDTQSLGFFAYGGSQNIIVNTDGNYKVMASDSWITIDNSITGMMNVIVSMNQEEGARRGTVSIELTDLTEGSLTIVIPVIQLGQGASFIKEEYPIDKDWNISEKHGFELSITGFTTDKDWNSSSTSTVNLIKTGYREETDWNPSSDKTGEFSKDGYENETNWDTSSEQSATIEKNNYEDDKDWNSSSDKIGTISKDNYGNDADWSLPANQGVTISKTSYEDDKNWNN